MLTEPFIERTTHLFWHFNKLQAIIFPFFLHLVDLSHKSQLADQKELFSLWKSFRCDAECPFVCHKASLPLPPLPDLSPV